MKMSNYSNYSMEEVYNILKFSFDNEWENVTGYSEKRYQRLIIDLCKTILEYEE